MKAQYKKHSFARFFILNIIDFNILKTLSTNSIDGNISCENIQDVTIIRNKYAKKIS